MATILQLPDEQVITDTDMMVGDEYLHNGLKYRVARIDANAAYGLPPIATMELVNTKPSELSANDIQQAGEVPRATPNSSDSAGPSVAGEL